MISYMEKINNILAAMSACAFAVTLQAQNPVIQTCFTTDPAPMVHNDTLYLYTGHDEDKADFFWMQEWRVYSTTDMVEVLLVRVSSFKIE